MKLSELAEAAAVSKETIQYYVREGLLPKPPLRSKRQADYDESYIERIKIIKDLQENHLLPVAVIKRIVKRQKRTTALEREIYRLQREFFTPLDIFLPKAIIGEEDFMEASGLGPKWLAQFEEWKFITPEIRDNEKVYSNSDLIMGRVIMEGEKTGLGPKNGFDPANNKKIIEALRRLIVPFSEHFTETYKDESNKDEFFNKSVLSLEVMGIYFYHLFRKVTHETIMAQFKAMEIKQCKKSGQGKKRKIDSMAADT